MKEIIGRIIIDIDRVELNKLFVVDDMKRSIENGFHRCCTHCGSINKFDSEDIIYTGHTANLYCESCGEKEQLNAYYEKFAKKVMPQKNGCSYAIPTDEYHGWKCSVTDDACMFILPNAKACAQKFNEGPLAERVDEEVYQMDLLCKEYLNINKYFQDKMDHILSSFNEILGKKKYTEVITRILIKEWSCINNPEEKREISIRTNKIQNDTIQNIFGYFGINIRECDGFSSIEWDENTFK